MGPRIVSLTSKGSGGWGDGKRPSGLGNRNRRSTLSLGKSTVSEEERGTGLDGKRPTGVEGEGLLTTLFILRKERNAMKEKRIRPRELNFLVFQRSFSFCQTFTGMAPLVHDWRAGPFRKKKEKKSIDREIHLLWILLFLSSILNSLTYS